jgi:hypothetical protein
MEPAYVLAPLGVFLLICQLILCRAARSCRWSNHWLFPYVAEAGDYLPNVLGSVAMASIPDEPSAVVLLLYLVVLNNSMAAYDREKVSLRYLWTAVNVVCFAYRALSAVGRADLGGAGMYAGAYAIVAAMLGAYTYCNVLVALVRAGKHYPEAIAEHMIAEHMSATEHVPQTKDQYNASTLEGYRYVVLLEPRKRTVDQIFAGGEERRRKDLCLSFALFQLLFCLYQGVPWYQNASDQKSQKLVVEGLLGRRPPPPVPPRRQQQQQEEAHHDQATRRGFGVVEAELAFLHDHIHGGCILWSPGSGAFRALYYVLKAAMAAIMHVAGLALCLAWDRPRVSVVISPLLLYLLFDLLQVVLYCRSDRWMVSYVCHPDAWQQRCFGRFISLIRPREPNINRSYFYWLDSVHQYSLLEETSTALWDSIGRRSSSTPFRQASLYSHGARPSGPVALPPSLKLRIAEVLGGTSCPVAVPPLVERAQWFRGKEPKQKIDVILKWHIATSYCEMLLLQRGTLLHGSRSRECAVVLSKYCAYLVAFRPELLPCPDTVTRCTFCNVLGEVVSLVGGQRSLRSRLATLRQRREARNVAARGLSSQDAGILTEGLKLGHLLFTKMESSQQDLWAILERIWVKLILGVAPQESAHDATYAKSHGRCLAQGGEFLTYLWALLSHAGVQKHSSWPPCIRNETVTRWDGFIPNFMYN